MNWDNYTSILFALLRHALWQSKEEIPHELSGEESKRFLSEAKKQAVLGLVIDSLIKQEVVRLPHKRVIEVTLALEKIKRGNYRVNEGVVKLHMLLEEYGVNYAVMKGQVVASYYPNSMIRQFGDIDYYCCPVDFEQSLQTVRESWNVQPKINGSEKHADYEYQGNRYEPHYMLIDLHSKLRNNYLQELIDKDKRAVAVINGIAVRTLSPTLHSLYIFLHLYFHLIELGVGLRQFCDWAMILHACRDEIDHDAIKQHLKVFGMEKAYRVCGSVLADNLGLPSDEFTYPLTDKDRKSADKILDVVFYRGNMGHYNKRAGFHGWRHKVESMCIKISHFMKFYPLAPEFMRDWGWSVLKKTMI